MSRIDTVLSKAEETMRQRIRQADANSPESQARAQRYNSLSEPVLDCLIRVIEWLEAYEEPGHADDDWRYQWSWLGQPAVDGQVPPLSREQRQSMTLAIEDFRLALPPMSGEQLLGRLRAAVPLIPAEGIT